MIRLFTLLLAASVLVFSAPDANKPAEIRRTVQNVKATVAQLQHQIVALESQLMSEAGVPAASVAATPEQPVQQAPTVIESVRPQCAEKTKRGARCSRMAAAGKSNCWQH